MLKIKLLLFSLVLMNLASASLNAQQRTRTKKPIPVKKESVSPKPKEAVPVKNPYNWNPVFTGQVSSLYTGKAGNEVFALTDSSLYRSENYGKDWTLVFSSPLNLPVPETPYTTDTFKWKLVFQQSKSDPQVMYLAAIGHHNNLTTNFYAGSLWKSVNGGKDWQHLNYNSLVSGSMPGDPRYKKGQGSVISSLAISPRNANTLYMIGVEYRLYKSLNGGENWTDITPDAMSPFRISINPHDAENMYLLNGQWDPLETTDGGSTWHKLKYDLSLLDTGSPGYGEDTDRRWTWITFHPDMPKRMLGIVNSHLVASDDGGKSWKDISFVTEKYRYRPGLLSEPRQGYKIASVQALDFSRTATDTLYISTGNGVYKTTDFGKTYNQLLQEPAFDFVVSKDDKKMLAATKLGTFQASEDFSKWANVGVSLSSVATDELSAIDGFDSPLYLLKSNGDIIKSTNSFDWEWERNSFKDITYKEGNYPADFKVIQFFKALDGTAYTVAAYRVYRKVIKETSDKNREEIKLPNFEYDWCNCRIALSKTDSQKIYVYSDKKLFVSNNGGVNWEESINNGVKVVAVSPQNSGTAYAVLTGNKSLNSVLTTTDGGKTWRAGASSLQDLAMTLGTTNSFQSVTVDPQNSNVAYVSSKNAVFRTSDSGQSWNLLAQDLFDGEIYDLTVDHTSSEIVYLATSNGVWQSKNAGKNWVSFSDKIPIYKVISSKDFTLAFGKEFIYRLQENEKNGVEEDKVYTDKEVDIKANFNKLEDQPQFKSDCPDNVDIILRAIMHKSGKVTGVTLIKGAGCSFDIEAIKAVRKLKFTPAIKDGRPVSQYLDVEFAAGRGNTKPPE
jgi:photosystem II stability/assembly factor-like uncharacterized protein